MKRSAARKQGEDSWPKTVFKKWLNISNDESDYSADEGDNESNFDGEEDWERELRNKERRGNGNQAESTAVLTKHCDHNSSSHKKYGDHDSSTHKNTEIMVALRSESVAEIQSHRRQLRESLSWRLVNHTENIPYKSRRRTSETLRAQYINTKELRVCVGTWNVGGKLPPDNLDIDEWLDMQEPVDIYVLGLQEIVPLNAGNIFGAEDNRPAQRWECLIRDALNRIRPAKPKYKCYSDPPSPSRFKPSDDAHATVDELLHETDSDSDDEAHPLDEESFSLAGDEHTAGTDDLNCNSDGAQRRTPMRRLERCHHFTSVNYEASPETTITQQKKLMKMLSSSERIGLVWPEQSLDLLAKCGAESMKPLRPVKSFRACNSFKPVRSDSMDCSGIGLIPEYNWDAILSKRRRSPFVRIASKQMVGIFHSIWVRRSLRKYIQNLKVSTVGVGIMGYIGNKGSVSISMSIYQTPFCFICTHLSSGEKIGDELRRNADAQEIHRRTSFGTGSSMGLPQTILDHERIFWFGDLNYRINLPYERTHELISKKKWSELVEGDQLKRELKKGRAFDGWSEGVIKFAPTYKYEFNSGKYICDDLKGGRRTPAWCDRILSFGTGMKLLNYRRSELKLSDHRPVTATFMAEVEVFSHRKLQKALTLTDAEVEDREILSDIDITTGMGRLRLGEDFSEWGQQN